MTWSVRQSTPSPVAARLYHRRARLSRHQYPSARSKRRLGRHQHHSHHQLRRPVRLRRSRSRQRCRRPSRRPRRRRRQALPPPRPRTARRLPLPVPPTLEMHRTLALRLPFHRCRLRRRAASSHPSPWQASGRPSSLRAASASLPLRCGSVEHVLVVRSGPRTHRSVRLELLVHMASGAAARLAVGEPCGEPPRPPSASLRPQSRLLHPPSAPRTVQMCRTLPWARRAWVGRARANRLRRNGHTRTQARAPQTRRPWRECTRTVEYSARPVPRRAECLATCPPRSCRGPQRTSWAIWTPGPSCD